MGGEHMSDQLSRSPRTVTVADHLWDTYALMSVEMGVDRDGLVNQALFAFARGHGYLTPGSTRASMPPPATAAVTPAPSTAPAAAVAPAPVPAVAAPVAFTPAPVPAVSAAFQSLPSIPPVPTPAPAAFVAAAVEPAPAAAAAVEPAPVVAAAVEPAPVASVSSVPEFTPSPLAAASAVPDDATPASGLSPTPLASEALPEQDPDPKATAAIRIRSTPTPVEPLPAAPSVPAMTPEEVRAAQERVLQKAAELERMVRGEDSLPPATHEEPLPADLPVEHEEGTPATGAAPEPTLVIYAEGREVDRVTSARFLIGRGKHCDLIINSGKVSREHAAIMREGDAFYIEDLGSSNGTWFDKKRITRRRVEDGDEYFVCSEKLSCRVTY